MAIITQSDLIATVGQRGFWDEQQRVSKLQEKKPVLKRLSECLQNLCDFLIIRGAHKLNLELRKPCNLT